MDLITIALLVGAAKLMQGQKTSDALEYYPTQLIWSKTKKQWVFYMEILNPTKHDLTVDSFFGGLFINDDKVGSIERGNSFVIKKKSRTKVSFPVKVVGLGLGKAIVAYIKDPSEKITVKILGTARALGLDNAISEEIPITTE